MTLVLKLCRGNRKFSALDPVLKKTDSKKLAKKEIEIGDYNPGFEEMSLLRTAYRFPEMVQEAGENFSPNLLCNFLFELAQKYNFFYNKVSILKADNPDLVEFRLTLTLAIAQVLKNGLSLLGIATPERM